MALFPHSFVNTIGPNTPSLKISYLYFRPSSSTPIKTSNFCSVFLDHVQSTMDEAQSQKILPIFVPMVKKALQTEFASGSVELSKICGDYKVSTDKLQSGHYFTFSLPYAAKHIEWEILFNPSNTSQPPDFLCSEDIDYDPKIYKKVVQNWNSSSEDSLANLLKELVKIYWVQQLAQLSYFPKAQDIYQSLLEAGISEDNIEVSHLTNQKKINILVKLDITVDHLPLINHGGNKQFYAGLLFLLSTDGKIISHSLVVSPYLKSLLGAHLERIRLSPTSKQSMMDPSVLEDCCRSLEDILNNIRKDQAKRRHIVATLLDIYPENVADYDKGQYHHATLHFTQENSRYAAHFKLIGEMELVLFAMDRSIKVGKDECLFSDSGPLSITQKYFARDLHETLTSRLDKFIDKVNKLPPV